MITGTHKGATLNANHCLYAPLALSFLKSEAGEGFFWFLVVIVTIIVQAVRASKQKSQKPDEKDSTVYTAPEDDLRNFLESISGQNRQSQEQSQPAGQKTSPAQAASAATHASDAPLSASAAATGNEKKRVAYEDRAKRSESRSAALGTGSGEPRRRRYVSSVAAPKGKPSTIEKTELQVRKRKPERVETAVSVTEAQPPGIAGTAQRAYPNILRYLRSRNSLREAVILREILGPPVALRSEPTQRITQ